MSRRYPSMVAGLRSFFPSASIGPSNRNSCASRRRRRQYSRSLFILPRTSLQRRQKDHIPLQSLGLVNRHDLHANAAASIGRSEQLVQLGGKVLRVAQHGCRRLRVQQCKIRFSVAYSLLAIAQARRPAKPQPGGLDQYPQRSAPPLRQRIFQHRHANAPAPFAPARKAALSSHATVHPLWSAHLRGTVPADRPVPGHTTAPAELPARRCGPRDPSMPSATLPGRVPADDPRAGRFSPRDMGFPRRTKPPPIPANEFASAPAPRWEAFHSPRAGSASSRRMHSARYFASPARSPLAKPRDRNRRSVKGRARSFRRLFRIPHRIGQIALLAQNRRKNLVEPFDQIRLRAEVLS